MSSRESIFRLPRLVGVPRRHLSTILVFGVAFVLGAAPFLGAKKIPGFVPLISVFGVEHRELLLPVSSFLMGLVALAIQFYAGESIASQSVRRSFGLLLLVVAAGTLGLVYLYAEKVVKVEGFDEPFVIGWARYSDCPCPRGNNGECIAGLAQNVDDCWRGVGQVKLALYLCYLVAIEGFVTLCGLLVLQRPKRRTRRRAAAAATPPEKQPAETSD